MQRRVLQAFRGWIGFVAFMDIGTAFRCYIEKRSFLSQKQEIDNIESNNTISRMVGIYCLLKAVALVHCTLYIHFKPVVFFGRWTILLTMALYLVEAVYYKSTTINFYVIFPFSLNFLTLFGLFYIPRRMKLWDRSNSNEDENNLLIRQMKTLKKRKVRKLS